MSRAVRMLVGVGLLIAASVPAWSAAELVLEDGQRIRGSGVERRGDLYLLELETGAVLPVPVPLVARLELSGDDAEPATGIEPAEARTVSGPPDWTRPPRLAEQVENLGQAARFREGPIDPAWTPTSDWDMSLERNDFNPSRWYRPPIDPTWTPSSVFKAEDDVTDFSPARWYRAPNDPVWWPSDGFSDRDE